MTTNQILVGLGLIVVLAVGSQVLASRLRIPALIVLLPVGFAAGALTSDVNPDKLLGPAFQPMVSLAVAVILYDAGLGLELRKLTGHPRRVVWRLIALGVPITMALATCMALLLLGMPSQAALMTGAILVVFRAHGRRPAAYLRPAQRRREGSGSWPGEGSLMNPVEGDPSGRRLPLHRGRHAARFRRPDRPVPGQHRRGPGRRRRRHRAAFPAAAAAAGLGEIIGTTAQLAAVIAVAAACGVLRDDTGLITTRSSWASRRPPAARPSRPGGQGFETLVQLIIGLLFISISATVTPASVRHLILPTVGLVASWSWSPARSPPGRPRADRPDQG